MDWRAEPLFLGRPFSSFFSFFLFSFFLFFFFFFIIPLPPKFHHPFFFLPFFSFSCLFPNHDPISLFSFLFIYLLFCASTRTVPYSSMRGGRAGKSFGGGEQLQQEVGEVLEDGLWLQLLPV